MIDRQKILSMAKQVLGGDYTENGHWPFFIEELEQYTALAVKTATEEEREACARINAEKSNRLAQEAEQAIEEGDHDTCTSNRAAAHLLSVCAARIRARGTGGEG